MVEFDEADWRKRLQQAQTGEELLAMVRELPMPPDFTGPPTEAEWLEFDANSPQSVHALHTQNNKIDEGLA